MILGAWISLLLEPAVNVLVPCCCMYHSKGTQKQVNLGSFDLRKVQALRAHQTRSFISYWTKNMDIHMYRIQKDSAVLSVPTAGQRVPLHEFLFLRSKTCKLDWTQVAQNGRIRSAQFRCTSLSDGRRVIDTPIGRASRPKQGSAGKGKRFHEQHVDEWL